MGQSVLYLNRGNFRFEDITDQSGIVTKGWSTGVSIADVNGDGWMDIYLCKSGNIQDAQSRNELFLNNGDQTFSEKAGEYGLDEPGNCTQGIFFDYDKDGDLDLFLLKNYPKAIGIINLEHNQRNVRDSDGGDKLFRNDNNIFTDVSEAAGIYGSVIGFGMGVCVGDIDMDGWPDVYVANDFFERDYIYLNNHNGTFRETLTQMIRSVSISSMGGDLADINNDDYPEIFVTDMLPEHNDRLKTKTTFDDWDNYSSNVSNGYYPQFTRNMLQKNNADGTFSEIGRFSGLSATDWSWGALITDLDNDGLKDIFVANGIYKDLTDQDYIRYFSNPDMVMSIISGNKIDYKTLIDAIPSVKIPNCTFKNTGNFRFTDISDVWGLDEPSFSNGAAYGDLDNDGDLDLVVNNVNMPMFIYRNETNSKKPENHYLKFILKGKGANTEALGTKITVKSKGKTFYLEHMPMRGYLSTADYSPNLGVGNIIVADSVIVEWPDERVTILTGVKTNQTLTLSQAEGLNIEWKKTSQKQYKPYFRDISKENRLSFNHIENEFNDFKRDKLIPQMMSTEGPRMCKGDMNGDGLEDIYIGGASGQPGVLMYQSKEGKFIPADIPVFVQDKICEDTDCAMFDADGDGDLDLYVASGGNEFPESSSALIDRLYLNNGKGKFTKSDQILPAGKFETTACVRAADFDNDSVMELFVGIRLKPFAYGIPVNGYILENDGKGHFRDVTSVIAPELLNTGMIRDMLWEDADNDGDKDIILAGEWMPLRIFINDNGKFSLKRNAFGTINTSGWWNCLSAGDFDDDGDIDFIAGNHGLNSRFKASASRPVSMYVNDFDLNGTVEQIICAYHGDRSYPIVLKHDLTGQIPELSAKYMKYVTYKDQTITDIFSAEQLKNSLHLDACMLETSLFINDGKGNFSTRPLPQEVQFSPVYAAETGYFDNDGETDILLGGNLYNVKPEVGRYDASFGSFLKGNGEGEFINIPAVKSGFYLDGEIRDILEVSTSKGNLLVVAGSNKPVQIFEELKK
jgi:hypothetical protein